MKWIFAALSFLAAAIAVSAASAANPMRIESPAFNAGDSIPVRYTCDGENVSPPLKWSGVPEDARSLALIVDDPDAPHGTFVHWVLYNLPASVTQLNPGVTPEQGAHGARFGVNSKGEPAYTGPCPPSGVHHYHFTLYALDTRLRTQGHMTKAELLQAMQGHRVGMAELIGTYRRNGK